MPNHSYQQKCINIYKQADYLEIDSAYFEVTKGYGRCQDLFKSHPEEFWSVIDISDRKDQMFKRYLLRSLWTDWLQISREASWCGSLPK